MFTTRPFQRLLFAIGLATSTFIGLTISSTMALAKTHEVSMTAVETDVVIEGSGEKYAAWTFNGQMPGPVVRVTEGDTVKFTLTNPATNKYPHAMDFHAAEIDFLNNLIVRKHFSWTQVFSNLEGVIPDNVHLTTVAPEIFKDRVSLHMEIVCKSISDESEFIRRLQASPVFQDVVVAKEERKGAAGSSDVAVDLTVSYFPEKALPERASK